jgi:potassium-transporting ATPase KdpC subunit
MRTPIAGQALRAVVFLVIFSVLLGVVYPLVVTGFAQVFYRDKANGSIIADNGHILGSSLIGQPFGDPKYFWGRLSATSPAPYNAGSSAASNLGPSNPALLDAVRARVEALRAVDPDNHLPIPVDLVTSSASGLDPDISVAAADYQTARVARVRGLNEQDVTALVRKHTRGRQFGILGEPRANVLELNLALDALE